MSLTDSLPIYVTRKDADGETGTYSLSGWAVLLAMLLIWLNIVVWGFLGLYFAVAVIL